MKRKITLKPIKSGAFDFFVLGSGFVKIAPMSITTEINKNKKEK
jgi:hypothetical protein